MEIIVICEKYHRTSAKEGCYFLTVSGDFKSSSYRPFLMISPARQLRNSEQRCLILEISYFIFK